MHFSKTYSQLLITLPDELQNSAIQYRQLKKLIKNLVTELESLGLTPLVLHDLLQQNLEHESLKPLSHSHSFNRGGSKGKERADGDNLSTDYQSLLSVSLPPSITRGRSSPPAKATYELTHEGHSGDIVPRLRLWLGESGLQSSSIPSPKGAFEEMEDCEDANGSSLSTSPNQSQTALSIDTRNLSVVEAASRELCDHGDNVVIMSSPVTIHSRRDLLWSLQERPVIQGLNSWNTVNDVDTISRNTDDFGHSAVLMDEDSSSQVVIPLASDTEFFRLLINALNSLTAALKASQKDFISSIDALSAIVARTSRPASARGKSDLYTWRAIFQMYMEAQVFESASERDRGQRSVEDSEMRLAQFARRVGESCFSLRITASRDGLERFLELNVRLLNLKKFQSANAEAARKILKKHAKRTALPLPSSATELIPALELGRATASVPHVLVVALTETLMPVVPHIDDYLCLICTAIAFKPIRLHCGHLFCVRCLVKMQKQGKANCPMCRAATVLTADKSNVDHALINLMRDWFPKESKEKARDNERESAKENMEELGLDTRCIVM